MHDTVINIGRVRRYQDGTATNTALCAADLLAGRKTSGTTSGEILFSNTKPSKAFLQRHTGYVEQFDTLIPVLTVREMLMYTADMKRGRDTPEQRRAIVKALLDQLALRQCQATKIGDPLTRCASPARSR